MARRVLNDIDNKIIKAVLEIGGKNGVNSVSAQKVAAMCDISHFTCFEHFGTKRGMLDAVAQDFDRRYMKKMKYWLDREKTIEQVWDAMLDAFIADPYGTLFYNDYIYRFGFDPTHTNERSVEFLPYAKAYFGDRYESDDEYLLYWDYTTSMAFYYAEKLIHGYIENSPEIRSSIKTIVFCGINKR